MTGRGLRKLMRQRRRELRHRLSEVRARQKERLRAAPDSPAARAIRKAKRRRRVRRAVILAVLVALFLIARCDCAPGLPAAGTPPEPVVVEPKKAMPAKVPRQPLGSLAGQKARPIMDQTSKTPPSWLDHFRLQVSGRSPRLAACFAGTDHPGTLRWTTSVSPSNGQVADHELEALGATSELNTAQRGCLLGVLSDPPFQVQAGAEAPSTPVRVSIIIEF